MCVVEAPKLDFRPMASKISWLLKARLCRLNSSPPPAPAVQPFGIAGAGSEVGLYGGVNSASSRFAVSGDSAGFSSAGGGCGRGGQTTAGLCAAQLASQIPAPAISSVQQAVFSSEFTLEFLCNACVFSLGPVRLGLCCDDGGIPLCPHVVLTGLVAAMAEPPEAGNQAK